MDYTQRDIGKPLLGAGCLYWLSNGATTWAGWPHVLSGVVCGFPCSKQILCSGWDLERLPAWIMELESGR